MESVVTGISLIDPWPLAPCCAGRPRARGYTYVARLGNLIKIGLTRVPAIRFDQLRKQFGELELLALVRGWPLETMLRRECSDFHVKEMPGREWYRAEAWDRVAYRFVSSDVCAACKAGL